MTTLWGDEHTGLGEVHVERVADRVALAITRGRHPKRYSYVDPNEDAVSAVVGERATLLVAADGHEGFASTRAAVEASLARLAGDGDPDPETGEDALADAVYAAGEAVQAATRELAGRPRESRTTLIVAILDERPTADGARTLRYASMGDSALLILGGGRPREFGHRVHHFVGFPLTRDRAAQVIRRGTDRLAPGEWVVAITDGFTEFVDLAEPAAAAEAVLATLDAPDAASLARALIARADAAGAGDATSVVVVAPPSAAA